MRIFLGSALALGLGLGFLDASARPWLFGAFIGSLALVGYTLWDETRGRAARVASLRKRWLEFGAIERDSLPTSPRPTGLDRGDLHLMQDGQPIVVRISLLKDVPTVAVLTPLPETTTAFRIASRHHPRPSFDGIEPALRGAALEALPGVGATLGSAFHVEGNDPTRLLRLLDEALADALAHADLHHRDTFRGLTFDGRFLAVHWLGDDLASDPMGALAMAAPFWRPFIPRLPAIPREILN